MWVESIVCNISVVFWDTVYTGEVGRSVTSSHRNDLTSAGSRSDFFSRGVMYAALKPDGTTPRDKERLKSAVKKGANTSTCSFNRRVGIGSVPHCLSDSWQTAVMTSEGVMNSDSMWILTSQKLTHTHPLLKLEVISAFSGFAEPKTGFLTVISLMVSVRRAQPAFGSSSSNVTRHQNTTDYYKYRNKMSNWSATKVSCFDPQCKQNGHKIHNLQLIKSIKSQNILTFSIAIRTVTHQYFV